MNARTRKDAPLDEYLTRWSLTDPRQLAATPTSTVYQVARAGEPVILKLLTECGIVDETGGAAALAPFDGNGAVRLLAHDDRAQLLEYASGGDLTDLVARGHDEEATNILADVMNRLHSADVDPRARALMPLRRRFAALFERSAQDDEPLHRQAAAIAGRLLSEPLGDCVLHGDVHHGNVRVAGTRGWLAIDPKGLVGERTFDAANVLLNPVALPEVVLAPGRCLRTIERLTLEMRLDRERLLAFTFCFACLSACWSEQDNDDPSLALAVARMVAPHVPPV